MKIVIFIFLYLILTSCKDEEKVNDEMVKLKLEELRQNFIKEKTEKCNKKLNL